ncbi:glycosyltransferase family 4 protein [Mycobacterium sp. 94-17]|uniref:glycosyltransferase family 4 protein n=1 Tax=Mycobacterium sp. 94-17 TaxID=2986147 RepID=UPI002D1EA79C|nr:glycosyltransferase family 4 protein [Mycobacterium sp. 94-17]MEB4210075.1 glycosyltransferase family 4 protein [Mycobacterium sp. 94-17]
MTDAVAPWHSGGKETRTWHYSQQLARSGFEVHIYTMKWWDSGHFTDQGPVRLHALCRQWPLYTRQRRSIVEAVAFSLACVRLLTVPFDLVEVDQIPILPLLAVKMVCLIRRKPMVATWHEVWGKDYWQSYLGGLGAVAALLERLVLRLPDRIIAVSEGTAQRVRQISARRTPVVVGHNGIDPDEILGAPADGRCTDLLFVGRLLDHKGVDALIDAVAELSGRGTSLSLTVVGKGPEEAALRQRAAALDVAAQVTFTGELPTHAEVIGRMKSARLMVFPTRREGFGLAAVEAMACGTPVITTEHPDNFARLLIAPGRNGYLCRPDGRDLADLIVRALAERPMLSLGAVETASRYTWHEAVGRCLGTYTGAKRNSSTPHRDEALCVTGRPSHAG